MGVAARKNDQDPIRGAHQGQRLMPHQQAGHMTCTRPQAARQIPLATRAPSTHDPSYCLICRCYRREGLWAGRSDHRTQRRPQPRAGGQRMWVWSASSRPSTSRQPSCEAPSIAAARWNAASCRTAQGRSRLNRPTMASAVSCGSAASQPSTVRTCGSSMDGVRTRRT